MSSGVEEEEGRAEKDCGEVDDTNERLLSLWLRLQVMKARIEAGG